MVSLMHEQNVIYSQIQLDFIAHFSRPLFVSNYLQIMWWALANEKGEKFASNDNVTHSVNNVED